MLSLHQSAPLPAPTTVLVDLVPLAIGTSLILKGKNESAKDDSKWKRLEIDVVVSLGIFFGNSIAHLANDDNRFREPRGSNLHLHHHQRHLPPQYYHHPGLYRYKLSGV